MRHPLSLGVVALSLGLVACGEKAQVAGGRKADQAPSATATSAYTTGDWKQGDAAAWERHLNARAQAGQNEYGRVAPR